MTSILDHFHYRNIELSDRGPGREIHSAMAHCYGDFGIANATMMLKRHGVETTGIQKLMGPEAWVIFCLWNGGLFYGMPAFKRLEDAAKAVMELSKLYNSWAHIDTDAVYEKWDEISKIMANNRGIPLQILLGTPSDKYKVDDNTRLNGYGDIQ